MSFWVRGVFPGIGIVEEGHHLEYEVAMEIANDLRKRGLQVEFGTEGYAMPCEGGAALVSTAVM